jgi:hypothetical protein
MPIAILQDPSALTVERELSAMYLQNKYSQYYYNIIHRAQSRVVLPDIIEKHHIIPKSLGGSNDKNNLVCLTPKEHFVCHLLLTKMCEGKHKQKMVYALWAIMNLCNNHQYRKQVKGRLYEQIRIEFVKSQKLSAGKTHPNYGRKRPERTKESFTDEWKAKISASKKGKPTWNKGVPRLDSVKEAISRANKGKLAWNKGVPCNPETARKSSQTQMGKRWVYKLDPFERQSIRPEQFNFYIQTGWQAGFGPRVKN